MKSKRQLFGVVRWLACGLLACSAIAKADEEADRAALRKIKAAYEDAVNSNDLSKIAPYIANEATGVMLTGQEISGFKGLEEYNQKIRALIGPGGTYQVKVNVEKTDIFGDTAVSRGTTDDFIRSSSRNEFKFTAYWTAVCQKGNDQWKVIRMQATMDPVDNVFVKMKLRVTKVSFGIAGLAGGLIALLLITRIRRRPVQAP